MEKKKCGLTTIYDPDYFPGTGISAELVNLRYIPAHIHENALELVYCLQGDVYLNVAHESCHIGSGEVITIDEEDVRNLMADTDNITLIVHINTSGTQYAEEDLKNTLFSCAHFLATDTTLPYLEKVCDKLLAAGFASASGSAAQDTKTLLDSIHRNLLDDLVEHFSWFSVLDKNNEYDEKYRERLLKIISLTNEQFTGKPTITGFAEELFLNPSYLSSFLHRTSFGSFTSMINYFRCLSAQLMLLKTDKSVHEISALAGFSSDKYFYKYFKYYWQTSPYQYRKRFRDYDRIPEEYTRFPDEETIEILKNYITERHIAAASC